MPDYDVGQEEPVELAAHTTNMRPHSGKCSKEAKRKQVARWRSRNKGRYRAYMREYMRNRRAMASACQG